MLLATLGSAVLAQLLAADISIDLRADSALVEARYEILEPVDSVGFAVIRLQGQELHPLPGSPPITLSTTGLYRFSVANAGAPMQEVSLRYVVRGDRARVPIAVPDASPVVEGAHVRMRVSGLASSASLDDGFPRLVPQVGGAAAATLETVPSFLRVPPDVPGWSINRLADASVIVLVLLATAFWLVRRRVHVAQPSNGAH
jgi:hypothetical protein